MSPVIRIDDEVMRELETRAYRMRRVFNSNPNEVLRSVLGLDDNPGESGAPQPTSSLPAPPRSQSVQAENGRKPLRVRGGALLRAHRHLLGQGLKPYADRDGGFYEWPKRFPAIFFDRKGYKIFKTEESMISACDYSYPETRKVIIRGSISSLPGYVECPPDCPHRRLYGSAP